MRARPDARVAADDASAVRLVADVGGTNARFALVTGRNGSLREEHTLATDDHADLAGAASAYLAQVGAPRLLEAAVAIANPIAGDAVALTNNRWHFSIEATRQKLNLQRLVMLNDWEAMALAAPAFAAKDLEPVGGGTPVDTAPRVLMGPGTGLGMATLARTRGGEWLALPGEGGHASLAPTCTREADILRALWREHEHVSVERVLSGMGLENLYCAIATLDGVAVQPFDAPHISGQALAGTDAQCVEAVATFCAMLGAAAGNAALTLGARGGVYIGGGIVPRLGATFARSAFRERFEAKGRFRSYLAAIPTYVIHAEHPALIGAAMALGVHPR